MDAARLKYELKELRLTVRYLEDLVGGLEYEIRARDYTIKRLEAAGGAGPAAAGGRRLPAAAARRRS